MSLKPSCGSCSRKPHSLLPALSLLVRHPEPSCAFLAYCRACQTGCYYPCCCTRSHLLTVLPHPCAGLSCGFASIRPPLGLPPTVLSLWRQVQLVAWGRLDNGNTLSIRGVLKLTTSVISISNKAIEGRVCLVQMKLMPLRPSEKLLNVKWSGAL